MGPAIIGDDQMPTTFGGGTAPSVATSGGVAAATAGNGSYAVITAVRACDLYLFEGDIAVRIFQDVVSGTGQWRFQILQYVAALRGSGPPSPRTSRSAQAPTAAASTPAAPPSAGIVTNYQTNSPLAGF